MHDYIFIVCGTKYEKNIKNDKIIFKAFQFPDKKQINLIRLFYIQPIYCKK